LLAKKIAIVRDQIVETICSIHRFNSTIFRRKIAGVKRPAGWRR